MTHRPVNPEPLEPPPMSPTSRRSTRIPNAHPVFRLAAPIALLLALAVCATLIIPGSGLAGVPRNASVATKKTASISAKQRKARKTQKARKTAAATMLRRKITGLQVTNATATSVSLRWQVSPSSAGVTGYTVTRDGVVVATPTLPRAVVTGMQCGGTATIAVRARGYYGALSLPTSIMVSTDPCPDLVAPSTPTGLTLAGRTQSVLSLRWVAATDNVGVVDYEVFVGPAATADTADTSVSVDGLTCGTTYAVGVRSVDGAGNRSTLAQISAATSGCSDTQAPSTPTLTAALNGAKAQLSWTAATDNTGVSSYAVYQGTGLVVETTARQYTTGDLACGQSYTFGVEARDSAGNRSGRGTATVQAAACPAAPAPPPAAGDTNAPTVPGSLQVTSVDATSIALSWTASTDNVGVTGYGLYRNGTLDHSASGLTSPFTGLLCGSTYTLAVDAVDAAGNRSAKSTVTTSTAPCPDAQAPTTPGNLRTTSVTQTSAAITWDPSTDDGGVVGYGVYWSGVRIADTTDTSFVLTGLTCGTSTTVEVDAVDGSGNRSSKASRLLSTSACPDTQAPSAPTGLRTTSSTQSMLTLAWNAATDNVGVTSYDVFRDGTKVGTTTGVSQSISGLTCATSYTVGVEAIDAAGNHSTRATATASTSPCPDTGAPSAPSGLSTTKVAQTSLTISWTASTDNVAVTGYDVFRDGTKVGTTAGVSQNLTALACGTSYLLGVEAFDAAGNRSGRATLSAKTADCSAPSAQANVFMAPSGNDSTCARGDATKPCATLQGAMQKASPGDTVEMTAGTYSGSRLVTIDRAAPGVTFRPAAGASVTLSGGVRCDGCSGLSIVGDPSNVGRLALGTVDMINGADRLTIQNVDFTQNNTVYVRDSSNFTLDHSDIGPVTDNSNVNFSTYDNASWNKNITITNNLFHDMTIGQSTDHNEAIWMSNVDGGVISGNRFKRIYGNTADLFLTTPNSTSCHGTRNLTISNNWFGSTTYTGHDIAIQFGRDSNCSTTTTRQNLTFTGNCWEAEVNFGTLFQSGQQETMPGSSMSTSEVGNLSANQQQQGSNAQVSFAKWPFSILSSCPLDSSG